ncbi:sensor histidine kinase [Variovorax sp. PAMC26660]|uniref:sensor histidine kinase n=1 Tax=Variovorax sp. PAMC26660 TaxID=2762322 RepID=UPI00164D8108|nr:ATP-binding protein [Variovorax sp. PAMC26660]QNK67292.1 histidine kinase [Variovorax sp. PAMC26660]
MFTPQVFHLPHFLEDQYVWLSIASWCVLLTWLWPRVSRRRVLTWIALAAALHLTPVAAQVIRATSAITVLAHDMPVTFWALQGVNVLVLGMVVSIWYLSQRRVARYRQVQAILKERRRIASDLHDGVGSRLVALLASQDPKKSAEPDGLSMALQDCLLELQMTVDDLDDQTSASVVERLGHLRYRLQPAFDRLGIALEWHIPGTAHTCPLPPETAVQICRVAQEALSNALRHSHATRVELHFGPQVRSHGLMLEVRDNGRGLQASATVPTEHLGKGLRSMRARADAVHGELAVMDCAPHGLCIRLLIPCDEAPPVSVPPESESML